MVELQPLSTICAEGGLHVQFHEEVSSFVIIIENQQLCYLLVYLRGLKRYIYWAFMFANSVTEILPKAKNHECMSCVSSMREELR